MTREQTTPAANWCYQMLDCARVGGVPLSKAQFFYIQDGLKSITPLTEWQRLEHEQYCAEFKRLTRKPHATKRPRGIGRASCR